MFSDIFKKNQDLSNCKNFLGAPPQYASNLTESRINNSKNHHSAKEKAASSMNGCHEAFQRFVLITTLPRETTAT